LPSRVRLERRFDAARGHVDRTNLDAVRARGAQELRRRVEAHRLAVQERAEERRGLVALEPRGYVDEQSKARRVRLRETVFAEASDLLEDLLRELGRIAALEHAVDQTLLEAAEIAAPPPRGHRAAQLVGLARRESGRDDRELHDLLLEDRHA